MENRSLINEVRSHYDATWFKHVQHMNTFNFAINQSFHSYSSALQQQFIATEQNRVHVMSKTITSFSSLTGYGLLLNVWKSCSLLLLTACYMLASSNGFEKVCELRLASPFIKLITLYRIDNFSEIIIFPFACRKFKTSCKVDVAYLYEAVFIQLYHQSVLRSY